MNFKRHVGMLKAILVGFGLQAAEADFGKYSGVVIASSSDLHFQAEQAVENDDLEYVKALLKAGVQVHGDGNKLKSLFEFAQSDKMLEILKNNDNDDFELVK